MIGALVDLLGNYYVSDDFTNVETIARSILSAIPDDQVSLQFIGLAYYRRGDFKEARSIFDKAVRRRKSAAKIEWKQGDAYLAHGDYAAAACYEAATRHNPDLAQAWHDLGAALQTLGKHEQAIPAFRSALIAQPMFPQAMLAMGRSALRINDLAAAEDSFSRLRALQPNNDEAYSGLGQVYRKRRDFCAARACFAQGATCRGKAPRPVEEDQPAS